MGIQARKGKGPSKDLFHGVKGETSARKEQQVVEQSSVDVLAGERIYCLMRTAGASFEGAVVGLSTAG